MKVIAYRRVGKHVNSSAVIIVPGGVVPYVEMAVHLDVVEDARDAHLVQDPVSDKLIPMEEDVLDVEL